MFRLNSKQTKLLFWTLRISTMVGGSSAAGCARSAEQRLEGRWLGETIENVPEEQAASAAGWIRGTSFEFSGSSVTMSIPAEVPRSAEYKVLAGDENSVRLAIKRQDGQTDVAEFKLDTDRLMRWQLGHRYAAVLRREE